MSDSTCPACSRPELWRPHPEYVGFYDVSTHGQVRGVDRVVPSGLGNGWRHVRGRILTPVRHTDGYLRVQLKRIGTRTDKKIHRLVLETFVGPAPAGMEGCHDPDPDPDHNCVSNLRWDTRGGNNRDKRAHGTDHNVNKACCPLSHLLVAPNITAASARLGHRSCLACDRASSIVSLYRRRYGVSLDHKTEADRRYARIMEGVRSGVG